MMWAAIIALGAGSAGLAIWLVTTRREAHRIEARLEEALGNLDRLQRTFARFAPHPLVERVIGSDDPLAGDLKEVTVLFADLAGFTALSEHLPASTLVRVVNGYFDSMNEAIAEHGGHVATFLGDGLFALFGAFEPNPWQGADAARAALAMRAALARYNAELANQGLPRLSFGIGLHRDTGLAGLVGSRHKLDFTVAGGVVNVAARVQAYTRECDTDILLTRAVRDALDPRFTVRALQTVNLRGVGQPVELFALESIQPAGN
jgi:adenylate cyclase